MHSTLRIILVLLALTAAAPPQELPDPGFAQWRDKVDPAVENALRDLARVQRPNGSFAEGYGESTGIPARVGMALLSETPPGNPARALRLFCWVCCASDSVASMACPKL